MAEFDIIIIGAGIAGASAAYELSKSANICVLEREAFAGMHSTGRSAALFSETYGNPIIRALSRAGRPFYSAPAQDESGRAFAEAPLLKQRGALFLAKQDQLERLQRFYQEMQETLPDVQYLDKADCLELLPALREDYVAAGVCEPGAMDIDVDALLQGYLRGSKRRGCDIFYNREVTQISHQGGQWQVKSGAGEEEALHSAPVLINAAGAWADQIASLAGEEPIGLSPLRRTAATFDAPAQYDIERWPMVIDIAETFYFKPDAGVILASPADETPVDPHDAFAEEMDIAVAIDRVQQAADLPVHKINHSWAGLRSFTPDRTLVIGARAAAGQGQRPQFFWIAGQGGYGVQTAAGAAQCAAEILLHGRVPEAMAQAGLSVADFSPDRLTAA